MTEEEKYAISRLASNAFYYDKIHKKKWYEYKNKTMNFDSTRDAEIALIYIMKQEGGDM